jgi:hypothetical protein
LTIGINEIAAILKASDFTWKMISPTKLHSSPEQALASEKLWLVNSPTAKPDYA